MSKRGRPTDFTDAQYRSAEVVGTLRSHSAPLRRASSPSNRSTDEFVDRLRPEARRLPPFETRMKYPPESPRRDGSASRHITPTRSREVYTRKELDGPRYARSTSASRDRSFASVDSRGRSLSPITNPYGLRKNLEPGRTALNTRTHTPDRKRHSDVQQTIVTASVYRTGTGSRSRPVIDLKTQVSRSRGVMPSQRSVSPSPVKPENLAGSNQEAQKDAVTQTGLLRIPTKVSPETVASSRTELQETSRKLTVPTTRASSDVRRGEGDSVLQNPFNDRVQPKTHPLVEELFEDQIQRSSSTVSPSTTTPEHSRGKAPTTRPIIDPTGRGNVPSSQFSGGPTR